MSIGKCIVPSASDRNNGAPDRFGSEGCCACRTVENRDLPDRLRRMDLSSADSEAICGASILCSAASLLLCRTDDNFDPQLD